MNLAYNVLSQPPLGMANNVTIGEFQPPKTKPIGKKKYMIDGATYYLISKEELAKDMSAAGKNAVIECKKRIMSEAYRELEKQKEEYERVSNELIQEERDKRAKEFRTADRQHDFMYLLQFMLSVSCRILIEHFGWKPISEPFRWTKTAKFADLVATEISGICNDEFKDIRKYADDTYEKYGVRFDFTEEDEDDE